EDISRTDKKSQITRKSSLRMMRCPGDPSRDISSNKQRAQKNYHCHRRMIFVKDRIFVESIRQKIEIENAVSEVAPNAVEHEKDHDYGGNNGRRREKKQSTTDKDCPRTVKIS